MGEKFCIRHTCRVGVKMEDGRRCEGELGGKSHGTKIAQVEMREGEFTMREHLKGIT